MALACMRADDLARADRLVAAALDIWPTWPWGWLLRADLDRRQAKDPRTALQRAIRHAADETCDTLDLAQAFGDASGTPLESFVSIALTIDPSEETLTTLLTRLCGSVVRRKQALVFARQGYAAALPILWQEIARSCHVGDEPRKRTRIDWTLGVEELAGALSLLRDDSAPDLLALASSALGIWVKSELVEARDNPGRTLQRLMLVDDALRRASRVRSQSALPAALDEVRALRDAAEAREDEEKIRLADAKVKAEQAERDERQREQERASTVKSAPSRAVLTFAVVSLAGAAATLLFALSGRASRDALIALVLGVPVSSGVGLVMAETSLALAASRATRPGSAGDPMAPGCTGVLMMGGTIALFGAIGSFVLTCVGAMLASAAPSALWIGWGLASICCWGFTMYGVAERASRWRHRWTIRD